MKSGDQSQQSRRGESFESYLDTNTLTPTNLVVVLNNLKQDNVSTLTRDEQLVRRPELSLPQERCQGGTGRGTFRASWGQCPTLGSNRRKMY